MLRGTLVIDGRVCHNTNSTFSFLIQITGGNWTYRPIGEAFQPSDIKEAGLDVDCPNYEKLHYTKKRPRYTYWQYTSAGAPDPNVADAGTKCGEGRMCVHSLGEPAAANSELVYFVSANNEWFPHH